MSVFTKFVTAGLKEAFKKKGKLKKTERAVITRQVNKAAKALDVTPTEAQKGLRDAVKAPPPSKKKAGTFTPKKKNPPTEKDKGSNKGLSTSERKEKASMMRQSRSEIKKRKKGQDIEDNPSDAPGGRQKILIDVPGTKGRRQREVADPQNRLKGSQNFTAKEMENWTPAELEEFTRRGFGGSGRAMQEQMKRSGKGSMDEQSKKHGGKIERNMGGPAKPRKKTVFRRGGGQALRGFGKATYSNKMY